MRHLPNNFICISHGMGGYYAVHMTAYSNGHHEPQQTGIGRYAHREEAAMEARDWAMSENLQFIDEADY
jgi:hypothetical protein